MNKNPEGGAFQKRGPKGYKNQELVSSGPDRTETLANSQLVCSACVCSSKSTLQPREGGAHTHAPSWPLLGEGKSAFFKGVTLVIDHSSVNGPTQTRTWLAKIGLGGLQRIKEHEFGREWEERMVDLGRIRERHGVDKTKIYCRLVWNCQRIQTHNVFLSNP